MHIVSVSVHHSITRKAMNHPGFGIGWKNDRRLTDLDFADDISLAAQEDRVCQEMATNLAVQSISVRRRQKLSGPTISQTPSQST